nr:MAG TPA: hypothetical protein [Caudoviricetes sp.]
MVRGIILIVQAMLLLAGSKSKTNGTISTAIARCTQGGCQLMINGII